MLREKIILSVVMMSFFFMTSCGQKEEPNEQEKTAVEEEAAEAPRFTEMHSYGGWYCPDNFGGFPPVDIQHLDKVPVVSGRLPTEEEANNGTSLMYFDTRAFPNAKPLDIPLPRLARYFSRQTDRNELVIVIQAVVANEDTVVGFRFPSGGNGSAWYGEVDFLSDEETDELGSAPFVFLDAGINASKEEVWKAITKTTYAKELGERFDEKAFFEADWSDNANVHLNYESDDLKASGRAANVYGNIYIQIAYDRNGSTYTEKIFVGQQEDGSSQLIIVSGPYPKDLSAQQIDWENWLEEVKEMSEKDR